METGDPSFLAVNGAGDHSDTVHWLAEFPSEEPSAAPLVSPLNVPAVIESPGLEDWLAVFPSEASIRPTTSHRMWPAVPSAALQCPTDQMEILRLGSVPALGRLWRGMLAVTAAITAVAISTGILNGAILSPAARFSSVITVRLAQPTPILPRAAVASATVVGASPLPSRQSEAAIQAVLSRYRRAFSARDAAAVEALWPTVNTEVLGQAFDQLEERALEFGTCSIETAGLRAQAFCSGTASYVPRSGSRTRHVGSWQWIFHLRRLKDVWVIEGVEERALTKAS